MLFQVGLYISIAQMKKCHSNNSKTQHQSNLKLCHSLASAHSSYFCNSSRCMYLAQRHFVLFCRVLNNHRNRMKLRMMKLQVSLKLTASLISVLPIILLRYPCNVEFKSNSSTVFKRFYVLQCTWCEIPDAIICFTITVQFLAR